MANILKKLICINGNKRIIGMIANLSDKINSGKKSITNEQKTIPIEFSSINSLLTCVLGLDLKSNLLKKLRILKIKGAIIAKNR